MKSKEKPVKVRKIKEEELLREVTVKIWLERINTQEKITVKVLLDSRAIELVISLKFVRKFKLKKIKRPIYMRNINGTFNRKGLIEHTVEVNIYYQCQN